MSERTLVCIVCPNGCEMLVDDEGHVLNAKCAKGIAFAKEEMKNPKRTVCSTVLTVFPDFPVLAVRTSEPIDKDKVFAVMTFLRNLRLERRLNRGDVIVENILSTGADLISSSCMNYGYYDRKDDA